MTTHHPLLVAPCFAALLCTGIAQAQNPLPDPGFEDWMDGNPVGWTTNNNQFTGQPVTPNANGYTGTTALRGTYLGLISAPIVNTIDAANQPLPITQDYQHFSFYYQLHLASTVGSEMFAAGAVFTDASGQTVGQGVQFFTRTMNTDTWTFIDIPITYTGSDATGVNVNFTLNGLDAVEGSYFVVDDVALGNGPSGIQEVRQDVLGEPYPVPAVQELNVPFTLDRSGPVAIDVVDAWGRRVSTKDLGTLAPGRYKEVLDVHGLAAGIYSAMLHTANGVRVRTFMVGH